MMRARMLPLLAGLAVVFATPVDAESTVYEVTSPYHHIRVVDDGGMRFLYFDGDPQSRMSIADPLQGHFEYVEYLHLPWLWNDDIRSALVIGLGGGSIQRSYRAMYPQTRVDTAELDPKVIEVASTYFGVHETENLRIVAEDGRIFLKRSPRRYDLIVVDAYTRSRYGSGIPYPLVTKEFFELVASRLTGNGILAYNVIGGVGAGRDSVLSRVYHTLETCFPQLYLFPVVSSQNVVVVATVSSSPHSAQELELRAERLVRAGTVSIPTFLERVAQLRPGIPLGAAASRLLTDERAPASGLLETTYGGGWIPRQSLGSPREPSSAP